MIARPVIALDVRGTGNYSRLFCASQRKQHIHSSVLSLAPQVRDLQRCAMEAGPNAVHYSSRAIAADIELLRRALRLKRLDILGISYGTIIAQTYAMMFPSRTRSLILDSPSPFKYGRTEVSQSEHMAEYARIFKQRDGVNISILRNDLETILQRMRRSPLVVKVPRNDTRKTGLKQVVVDADSLFILYSSVTPGLPQALNHAAGLQRNTTLLERITVQSALQSPFITGIDYRLSSFATLLSVLCNDLLRVLPWHFKVVGIKRRMAGVRRMIARNRRLWKMFEPFEPSEAMVVVRFCIAFPFRQRWGQGLPSRRERDSVSNDLKALVLVGEWDSVTPLADVHLLDEGLRRNVAVIKETGHVTIVKPCAFELLVEFVVNLSVSNVKACA